MLNPKVDSPPFAATVTAAAPLQHYQVDPVHQPLGLTPKNMHGTRLTRNFIVLRKEVIDSIMPWYIYLNIKRKNNFFIDHGSFVHLI